MIEGLATFEHHAMPCPGCGQPCNRSDCAEADPRQPMMGDISICCYCASINVWQADGTWRAEQLASFDLATQARLKGALRLLSAHLRGKAVAS